MPLILTALEAESTVGQKFLCMSSGHTLDCVDYFMLAGRKKEVRGGNSEKQSQTLVHVEAKQKPAVTGR